jgi:hypothetical protein
MTARLLDRSAAGAEGGAVAGRLEPAGRPGATGQESDDSWPHLDEPVDWLVMEARDRLTNLAFFAAAGIVWILVGLVVTTRDPRIDPTAGSIGAVLMGLALGLSSVPLFWLTVFGRHRRIAYRGDWTRAIRRGGWVAIVAAVFVILRLQQVFQPPIALFILALVVLAETTLTVER